MDKQIENLPQYDVTFDGEYKGKAISRIKTHTRWRRQPSTLRGDDEFAYMLCVDVEFTDGSIGNLVLHSRGDLAQEVEEIPAAD